MGGIHNFSSEKRTVDIMAIKEKVQAMKKRKLAKQQAK
jgi:hypothetical protein